MVSQYPMLTSCDFPEISIVVYKRILLICLQNSLLTLNFQWAKDKYRYRNWNILWRIVLWTPRQHDSSSFFLRVFILPKNSLVAKLQLAVCCFKINKYSISSLYNRHETVVVVLLLATGAWVAPGPTATWAALLVCSGGVTGSNEALFGGPVRVTGGIGEGENDSGCRGGGEWFPRGGGSRRKC